MGFGGLLVDRSETAARTAPRRPEIDDHHRIFIDGLFEVLLSQLDGGHAAYLPRKRPVYSRHHVRRPVRTLAERTASLRLAGGCGGELARRARGARPLAPAH